MSPTNRRTVPVALGRRVRQRARHRCGYCLCSETLLGMPMEFDHLIPQAAGGTTRAENLWLACRRCNRWKGSDLSAIDSATGAITPLFNPRAHMWQEHFALEGAQIVGLTSVGRATVALLQFNEPRRVIQRRVLIDVGRYPPHA